MRDSGQFLELSVPTQDVRESLDFYLRLGFTEIPVNDIRTHYYAAVTDGRIAIGLHAAGYEDIALSFVWPDVARQVREYEDAGFVFSFARLGADEFNEAELLSPDGHALRILETRTFSQGSFGNVESTGIGQVTEVSLRSDDLLQSGAFWQVAGLDMAEDPTEGDEPTLLSAPGIVIGLRDDFRWQEPLLRFRPEDPDVTLGTLDRSHAPEKRHGEGRMIVTPEGLRLLVLIDELLWH